MPNLISLLFRYEMPFTSGRRILSRHHNDACLRCPFYTKISPPRYAAGGRLALARMSRESRCPRGHALASGLYHLPIVLRLLPLAAS